MIGQRPPGSAPAAQANAEDLPFEDDSFDAAMAVFTDHHWGDRPAGLREMRRVARRVVILNADPALAESFWLSRDYLPGFGDLIPEPYRRAGYWIQELGNHLGAVEERSVPVPHDCQDGFYQAYWRRPHAYLEQGVRDSTSVFHRLSGDEVTSAVDDLRRDLDDGSWKERNADLLCKPDLDLGLRLVIAT